MNDNLLPYLQSDAVVDWRTPVVTESARRLAEGLSADEAITRACFAFVRDRIRHSADYQLNPVTCSASETLRHGTGFCYAKSHLLAALLRANGIPAGFCYQRLTVADDAPPYCLHALNAVHLARHGWYRLDARGNKPGVQAEFTPPVERLAFRPAIEGEADLPEILCAPLDAVVEVLRNARTYRDVLRNLPDINVARGDL